MALKEMNQICQTIREKWENIKNIAIYHRLGEVPVEQASIVIGISSPHRKDSLEAVSFCIDEFKRLVRVWKKECYDDGTFSWKENCECSNKKN
jgi:molybdopterin synthase catalytic subunit